jgi:hypothetical protein
MPNRQRSGPTENTVGDNAYAEFHGCKYRSRISGRAILADGREFACYAKSVTVAEATIVADVSASVNQIVACYLEGIGMILGKIGRMTETGFILFLLVPQERRGQVAARLEWHQNRAMRISELRGAARIVPLHRDVEIRLGEQIVLRGTITDISLSGAAIVLDTAARPFVGARIRVGSRDASVARLTETGIAVQFIEPFLSDGFNEQVRP